MEKGENNDNYTYNLLGDDNLGQITVLGATQNRFYYIKDHLGTPRVTLNASGGIDGFADFYPYGMLMPTRNYEASADSRYKFTSKERDMAETGYDYFGARYYDSRIGRFLAVDPHDAVYPGQSPFAYAVDNPVVFLDPTGMDDSSKSQEKKPEAKKANTAPIVIPLPITIPSWLVEALGKASIVVWLATTFSGDQPPQALHSEDATKSSEKETAQTPKVRDISNPKSLEGASPEEVKSLIPPGWVESPSRKSEGVRYADPSHLGDQVRVMPGNPADPVAVKQGPYVVVSKSGKVSDHIPLSGNPTLQHQQ